MKKTMFVPLALSFVLFSCSKSDDPDPVNPAADKFMSTSAGSTWNYEATDNIPPASTETYTLTATSNDSISPSSTKSFRIFTNSAGGNEYYNITGDNYYTAQTLPDALGGAKIESLYLNATAAVNTTWSETVPMDVGLPSPINLTVTYKLAEKNLTRLVGANSYTNVIHVEVSIAAPAPFTSAVTSDIDRYYAPKKGLIEDNTKIDVVYPAAGLDEHIDTKTTLVSANIL